LKQPYSYIWEYVVAPASIAEFERFYGPSGPWVALFLRAEGYLRTELHRDRNNPCRYVTVDYWNSPEDHASFRSRFAEEFHEIDRLGEDLTESESFLGEFTPIGSQAARRESGPLLA